MRSIAERAERDQREALAVELLDKHGPMSCQELAVFMGVKSITCAGALKRLLRAGTHQQVETDRRDAGGNNRLHVYARIGVTIAKKDPAPRKAKKLNQSDRARIAIHEAGLKENITSKWLGEVMGLNSSDAGSILAGFVKTNEIAFQRKQRESKEGRATNFYKVVKLNIVPESVKIEAAEESMKRPIATMAAFHPATKRHDLRGTA